MKILVTGASGYFGSLLTNKLKEDPSIKSIVGIDIEKGIFRYEEAVSFFQADTGKKKVEEVFQQNPNIDVIVHLAYYTEAKYDEKIGLDTNIFGTMRMLEMAKKYKVKKFIFPSSTFVYGAHPDNPKIIDESMPLRGNRNIPFVRDKIEADLLCQLYMNEEELPKVSIIRLCTILGGKGFLNSYFNSKIIPIVLNFDPQFQLIHDKDVIKILHAAVIKDVEGIFNAASKTTEALSVLIKKTGKTYLPLPEFLLSQYANILRPLIKQNRSYSSPFDFSYLKYPFVVDNSKAKQLLDYVPER